MTPSTHFDSFPGQGAQILKVNMQVAHGVLVDWLTLEHFTKKWQAYLAEERLGCRENIVPAVLEAFRTQALLNTIVFAEVQSSDWRAVEKKIIAAVDARKAAAVKLWGNCETENEKKKEAPAPASFSSIDKQMNQHPPDHVHEDSTDIGLANSCGARFETKHGSSRRYAKSTNGKFPEADMMKRSTIVETLHYMAKSPHLHFQCLAAGVHEKLCTDKSMQMLLRTAMSGNTYAEGNTIDEEIKTEGDDHSADHVIVNGIMDHFKILNREAYANMVATGRWYHIGSFHVVRVHQCLRIEDVEHAVVDVYEPTDVVVRGAYNVLRLIDRKVYCPSLLGKPAHVWHNCEQGCGTASFSQCRATKNGTFVLNNMYLK
jgi:hypothetical protein